MKGQDHKVTHLDKMLSKERGFINRVCTLNTKSV